MNFYAEYGIECVTKSLKSYYIESNKVLFHLRDDILANHVRKTYSFWQTNYKEQQIY